MREKNISKDREKYLRKVYISRIVIIMTRLLIIVGFIFLWEILAKKDIIDSFIMSSPSRMLETFINLSKSNELTRHLNTTILETLIGFSLGTVLRKYYCYNTLVVKIFV